MKLPPLWRTVRLNRSGAEHCLYNAGSLESTKRKYHLAGWPLDGLYLIEHVPKEVAEARRYHEASPVEKIDIDIGRLQQRTMALKRLGAGKEAFAELAEKMAELHTDAKPSCKPPTGPPDRILFSRGRQRSGGWPGAGRTISVRHTTEPT